MLTLRFMKRLLVAALFVAGCGGTSSAVYPPRPPAVPGLAVSDPAPSKVVVHATITSAGLQHALDQQIPRSGSGAFHAVGSDHRYIWSRKPLELAFAQGRVNVHAHVDATVEALGTTMDFPLDLDIAAEPVVSSDYRARLQAPQVQVTSPDPRLRMAQSIGGALDSIRAQLETQVRTFVYDLRPIIAGDARSHRAADRSAARRRARLRDLDACSASRPARRCSPTASRKIWRWSWRRR